MNFRYSLHHTATGEIVSQKDHIKLVCSWRAVFWRCKFPCVESDRAFVLIRFALQLYEHRHKSQTRFVVRQLSNTAVRTHYKQKLSDEPRTSVNNNVDQQCGHINQTMHLTGVLGYPPRTNVNYWHPTCQETLSLMEPSGLPPICTEMNKTW